VSRKEGRKIEHFMLNEKDSTRLIELGSWSRNKYSSELPVSVSVYVSRNVSVSPAGILRELLLSSPHTTSLTNNLSGRIYR
jgi:hypothetical protein